MEVLKPPFQCSQTYFNTMEVLKPPFQCSQTYFDTMEVLKKLQGNFIWITKAKIVLHHISFAILHLEILHFIAVITSCYRNYITP